MENKFWDNMGYLILGLLLIGQGAYLIGNTINLIRDFKLGRPRADKIKNTCFATITIGLIILRLI